MNKLSTNSDNFGNLCGTYIIPLSNLFRNIYGKLEVNNRARVVDKAKALGILPTF